MTRQELALFFNVLVLLALSTSYFSKVQRYILAVIFGMSMIWSHYSTTYIAVVILIFVLLIRNVRLGVIFKRVKRFLAAKATPVLSRVSINKVESTAAETEGGFTEGEKKEREYAGWLPGWRYVLTLLILTLS